MAGSPPYVPDIESPAHDPRATVSTLSTPEVSEDDEINDITVTTHVTMEVETIDTLNSGSKVKRLKAVMCRGLSNESRIRRCPFNCIAMKKMGHRDLLKWNSSGCLFSTPPSLNLSLSLHNSVVAVEGIRTPFTAANYHHDEGRA